MQVKYSAAEMRMIDYFGLAYIADRVEPPMLYDMMVHEAFIRGENTVMACSLRRCILALANGSVYRLTPEWDAMITGE